MCSTLEFDIIRRRIDKIRSVLKESDDLEDPEQLDTEAQTLDDYLGQVPKPVISQRVQRMLQQEIETLQYDQREKIAERKRLEQEIQEKSPHGSNPNSDDYNELIERYRYVQGKLKEIEELLNYAQSRVHANG